MMCNRNIIMSAFNKARMSYSEVAIMIFLKGGSYGRKGRDNDESGRIKAVVGH